MEFPEPWHQYAFEDWPRLEQAIRRLNSRRKRKSLPPLDPRPPAQSPRLRPLIARYGKTIMNTEKEQTMERGYRVEVDDNFHYMDEDERWCLGAFATYEEALVAAKQLVEQFFAEAKIGKTAEELYDGYVAMGDDPFIVPFGGAPQPKERFSAWNYAKKYAERLAGESG